MELDESVAGDTPYDGVSGGSAGASVDLDLREYAPTRGIATFELLDQIGEGTYGQVYKARDLLSRQLVALKRIRVEQEREGFPITALREIALLKRLRHPCIVDLRGIAADVAEPADISVGHGAYYMVRFFFNTGSAVCFWMITFANHRFLNIWRMISWACLRAALSISITIRFVGPRPILCAATNCHRRADSNHDAGLASRSSPLP
jgi:serine/threonine protein kinase